MQSARGRFSRPFPFRFRQTRDTLRTNMLTTSRWLNDYLEPHAAAEELADLLTRAGFPCEGMEDVQLANDTDIRLDIELTSNRGDCASHIGLAREAAAVSGRSLKLPAAAPKASGAVAASRAIAVENREPDLSPLYTARVIRGVKVGPSPDWLRDRLIARGDIPRNNIVDATNFVLFELGQPTHVFDLSTLRGAQIIIRKAHRDEPFLPIGEGAAEVKLSEADLVIADAERAVAIAGIKGGALTAVRDSTTDIVIEAATFAPAAVRSTSRRLGISSDSSYRFERGVHPGQIEFAANRLASLILELCGGELCEGVVSAGAPIPALRRIAMRCDRCRALLGVEIDDQTMRGFLDRLGFAPTLQSGRIECTVPAFRLDIEREIDLIEEIARMMGLDAVPVADTLRIRVAPPQPAVMAKRAVNDAMVGMGYIETVTHSLIGDRHAEAFLPPDLALIRVDDERAKAEPVLRPSVLPSLLRVFAHNRDCGTNDVRLFETAATFAQTSASHIERTNLALLHPAGSPEEGVRQARGVIERLAHLIVGADAVIDVEPCETLPWFTPGCGAAVRLNGDVLGVFGALAPQVLDLFGITQPMYAAEIGLPAYYDRYPPDAAAKPLPGFPAIERDLSAILDETTMWRDVHSHLMSLNLAHIEAIEFVTTFRGKQIETGQKSLTLRMRFRAADRTLTHQDVDTQTNTAIKSLESHFKAVIRR